MPVIVLKYRWRGILEAGAYTSWPPDAPFQNLPTPSLLWIVQLFPNGEALGNWIACWPTVSSAWWIFQQSNYIWISFNGASHRASWCSISALMHRPYLWDRFFFRRHCSRRKATLPLALPRFCPLLARHLLTIWSRSLTETPSACHHHGHSRLGTGARRRRGLACALPSRSGCPGHTRARLDSLALPPPLVRPWPAKSASSPASQCAALLRTK